MYAYIAQLAYYVPDITEENAEGSLRKKTGIRWRHICSKEQTAADLAVAAAEKLFLEGIQRDEIDFLLLCTQSPDYFLPSTSCILQDRLHLKHCIGALDFDLGCSGFVYGLGLAKGLIESGQVRNVLLLTAETYSKYIHPEDNSLRPLFGDAAAATLIVGQEAPMPGIRSVVYGTDGGGANHLIVPAGAMRHRSGETAVAETRDFYGNVRTNYNLFMDGLEIMNFAMRAVPKVVEEILAREQMAKSDVDYYVFHQANRFILERLRKKCGLRDMPYWNDVERYGNTVSNTLPIALHDILSTRDREYLQNVMLVGFGVGLSWGGCMVDLTKMQR